MRARISQVVTVLCPQNASASQVELGLLRPPPPLHTLHTTRALVLDAASIAAITDAVVSMLYFVKRHNVLVGGAPKVEGVILDAHNRVEMLQDVLQMEDACWLAADGKSWIVLDTEMRIGAAAVLLAGDGTVDSPWETKERVGGE